MSAVFIQLATLLDYLDATHEHAKGGYSSQPCSRTLVL